ncbi:hypothetical protein Tco_0593338 [Tanacetum coccineum]
MFGNQRTGKMFTTIGYIWRPTGWTFTIIGNACLLTRITTTTEAPLRKAVVLDNETSKPAVTLVYSWKLRKSKTNITVSKSRVLHLPKSFLQFVEVAAPKPAVSTGSPSSTTVDQDAPSPSNSQTTPDTQPPVIPNDVEEDNHDIEVAHMGNDPYFGIKS